MSYFVDRWETLRVVATIQAVLAWVLASSVVGWGIRVGGTMMTQAEGHRGQLEGLFVVVGAIVCGLLVWTSLITTAHIIRVLISLEEGVRELVRRPTRPG